MTDKTKKDEPLKFDVHPSVVYRLGDELITDVNQALLELIKNSYDADASYVKVTVNSTKPNDDPDSQYPGSLGSVSIEDDGTGMDLKTIINGWLLVSNSGKREFKKKGKVTGKDRTPLGDKGLGRLGAQRLGHNLEIITKTEDDSEQSKVSFSWNDFLNHKRLSDVPVYFTRSVSKKTKGTKVLISDLRDAGIWQGEDSLIALEKDLSSLLSPYKKIHDFRLLVFVNGKKLELTEVSAKLRELSQIRYKFLFDGQKFQINGLAKLDFFRSNQPDKLPEFSAIVESDEGEMFFDYLSHLPKADIYNLRRSPDSKFFIEFSYVINFDSLDKLILLDGIGANPGPFSGEIDHFNLGSMAFNYSVNSVFDRLAEFRDRVKELSGVKVYRDGFNIKVDHDWIGFGKGWSQDKSYYGLKPTTTLGYIDISARNNSQIEETTDREGFKNTPYYNNFFRLIKAFDSFSDDIHQFFRRGCIDFLKNNREKLIGLDRPAETEGLTKIIKSNAAEAQKHKSNLARIQRQRTSTSISSSDESSLENDLSNAIKYLDTVSKLEPVGQVLADRVDSLKEQIADMHETIGLGLTAEALSHEIFNISDNLAQKTSAIKSYMKQKEINDFRVLSYAEAVNTSTNALRKQVAHLSPSLKYVREKKEAIKLSNYFENSICDFYQSRLSKKNIRIEVVSSGKGEFSLYMNKGKLTQIIDNIVLNSEYWLTEDIRNNRLEEGVITFTLTCPFVVASDNGRGIEPAIETAIFEPFVTNKGREKGQKRGRGLGLFIIQQLLDTEGCSISLLPKRNNHNRFYSFQIDFRGALDER